MVIFVSEEVVEAKQDIITCQCGSVSQRIGSVKVHIQRKQMLRGLFGILIILVLFAFFV